MQSPHPTRRSDATRAAILAAARDRFAAEGYERATIRAIAADARIDPAMVMRYFGSKPKLFAAAVEIALGTPDLSAVPRDQVGVTLARFFLARWEGTETLIALLRSATTNESSAAERMRQVFAQQIGPMIATYTADQTEVPARSGLLVSQILGLALCRYVLRIPPVVEMRPEELIAWVGPTLQRYVAEPLPAIDPDGKER